MATFAGSFSFPVQFDNLSVDDVVGSVLSGDEFMYEQVLTAAKRLVAAGVGAVGTSCGYFSVYQQRLSADLNVPVFASALSQLPTILSLADPAHKIAILWAAENQLVRDALAGAGVDPDDARLVHIDMSGPGHFRDSILAGEIPVDISALEAQVVEACARVLAADADIRSFVFECGDLSACSEVVRTQLNTPVFDYVTLFEHAARVVGIR
jgi:hypothetical protein